MSSQSQLFSEIGRPLNHTDHDNQTLDIRSLFSLVGTGNANISVGTATPNPSSYNLWYKTDEGNLYFYDTSTSTWIQVSGAATLVGTGNSTFSSAALASLMSQLPTTEPATSGVLWRNGQFLAIS